MFLVTVCSQNELVSNRTDEVSVLASVTDIISCSYIYSLSPLLSQ